MRHFDYLKYNNICKVFFTAVMVLMLAVVLMLTSCESGEQNQHETDAAEEATVEENGTYDSKEKVAEYLSIYKKLPKNYITKKEARKLGWRGGYLEPYAPGKTIGGDRFGNREKKLPDDKGRKYYECDIDTLGAKKRGAKRIIYSNDGLIYYTGNHYKSFEKMARSA